MKKLLVMMMLLMLVTGCMSNSEPTKEQQAINEAEDEETNFTFIKDDYGFDLGLKVPDVNTVNMAIGDDYHEEHVDNQAIYYNDDIKIFVEDQEVVKAELYTDLYTVGFDIAQVGDSKEDISDSYDLKETKNINQYYALNVTNRKKLIFDFENDKIIKITQEYN